MTEFSNTRSSAKSRPSSITTRKGAGFNGQTIAPPLLTRVFQGQVLLLVSKRFAEELYSNIQNLTLSLLVTLGSLRLLVEKYWLAR